MLEIIEPQDDLPFGRTWQCDTCLTRVRDGQMHTASLPVPHQTVEALIVVSEHEQF